MKLHLPKGLLAAVLTVAVSIPLAANAATGLYQNNTYLLGGGIGENFYSVVNLEGSESTPEGGKLTTTVPEIDSSRLDSFAIWADSDANAWTNVIVEKWTLKDNAIITVSKSEWQTSGQDRYFDELHIKELIGNSCTLNVTEAANKVTVDKVTGSISSISNAGTLTIGTAISLSQVSSNTGTLILKGAVNEENISVSTGTWIIASSEANVTGKLYSNGGNITLGDGTNSGIITVGRVELSDKNGGDSLSLNVKSGYTLKVTGSQNKIVANSYNNKGHYKTNSFIVSEWDNSTTMNIEGTIMAENASMLTGDREVVINIENGGTLAVKGLGRAATDITPSQKSQLNLKSGGRLILGDMGVNFGGNLTATISGGTIGIAADTVTISEALNITGALKLDTTKYIYGDTALTQENSTGGKLILNGNLTGTGRVTASGAGTLQIGSISSGVDITANCTAMEYLGTLVMSDGKTLSLKDGLSVTIGTTDMSGFAKAQSFTDTNGIETTSGNGFARDTSYVLVNGGTISGEVTVNYGDTNYTINNDNRGFGTIDSSTDYTEYFLNKGSGSVATIAAYAAAQNASVNTYNLAAGTTLNVDAAPAAINVKGAATLNISEGITLNHSSVAIAQGASATLTGSGTYTISQDTLNAGTDATSSPAGILIGDTEGAKWTGQVNLLATGGYDTNNLLTVTWLNLNHYGNADSTIKLRGVSGYLCAANNGSAVTFTSDLIMENSYKAALELTDGCSADNFIFSGDITNGANGGNFIKDSRVQQNFTFTGNISGWTGEIKLLRGIENNGKISTITFSEKATEINNNITAADSSRQHNNKNVEVKATVRFDNSDSAVTMNGSITDSTTRDASELNLEVNTAKGTTFNGAVKVSKIKIEKGSSATFTKSVSTGMLEVLGNVSFTATDALSVSKLEMGAGAGVSVSTADAVGTLTVNTAATFNGGNVNANLKLADNATVTINDAVALGSASTVAPASTTETAYTLSLGTQLTLQGNVLEDLGKLAPGSGEVILFSGVDTLVMGGQTYSVGSHVLTATSGVKLSEVFRSDSVNLDDYYIGFNANGDVYAGLIVPEPTTATLSLLALAGLCARRRRASR